MNRILIVTILLVVVLGTGVAAFTQLTGTFIEPAVATQEQDGSPLLPSVEPSQAMSVNPVATKPQQMNTVDEVSELHQHEALDDQINLAAQFETLPTDMQQEIKQLSGRYNENVEAIEVAPGVFMMPPDKSVRVVPVAVMNQDGTVSIHEY